MSEQQTALQIDTELVLTKVLPTWERRRAANSWPKNHKRTIEKQLEYILGAIALLDSIRNDGLSCVPVVVWVNVLRGVYIELEG